MPSFPTLSVPLKYGHQPQLVDAVIKDDKDAGYQSRRLRYTRLTRRFPGLAYPHATPDDKHLLEFFEEVTCAGGSLPFDWSDPAWAYDGVLWQAGHTYAAGKIVRPTTANGRSYLATVAGTSGAIELYNGVPAEIIENGGFASDTTGWTAGNCTVASVAGGQAGNCLEITRTAGATQSVYQVVATITGARYRYTAYVKSGSSGPEAFYISGSGTTGSTSGTSSGTWTICTLDFVAEGATTTLYIVKNTATDGTMLFDTASCTRIPWPTTVGDTVVDGTVTWAENSRSVVFESPVIYKPVAYGLFDIEFSLLEV